MSAITLTVYCFFCILTLSVYRRISHPVVIFNLIWTVLIAVSMMSLIDLPVPPASSFEVFLKGGVVFNIFSLILYFINRFISNKTRTDSLKTVLTNKTKQKIVLALNIVILVYYLFKLIRISGLLGDFGNYIAIRSFYYSTDNFASSLEYNIVTFIFDPIIYLNAVIFALNTKKKQYHTYTLFIIFTNMILRTVISGGRMIMFEFAVCLFVAQLTHTKEEKNRKLDKKAKYTRLFILVALACLFMIASYITELRGGNGNSLAGNGISTFISNFTGSFSYFSVLNSYGKYYKPLYGRAMFAGLIDPIIMLLHFLKLTDVDIAQNALGSILSEFYLLGNHSYNAMPTMYYFFISDFREAGIVIGSVVLSAYCFVIERLKHYYNNYKFNALYLLMVLTIIESPMTWLPFKTSFVIANILVLLFASNNKIKKN